MIRAKKIIAIIMEGQVFFRI